MKLLKERYKTLDGAWKRARFENALAHSEYERGYKAKLYHYYTASEPTPDGKVIFRVAREVRRCTTNA